MPNWARIVVLVVSVALITAGCGNTKVINGIKYDTYGLLSEGAKKNPDIKYDVVWGNVVWGILFFQMIIPPIYFFGYSLFEPVCVKADTSRIAGREGELCANPAGE